MANPGFETNGISANPPSDGDPSGGRICRGIIDILRDAINRGGGGGSVVSDSKDGGTGSRGILPDAIVGSSGTKSIGEQIGLAVVRALLDSREQKPYLELPNCFPSTLIESLTDAQTDNESHSLGGALGRVAGDAERSGDIGEFSAIKALGQTLGEAAAVELGTPARAATSATGKLADDSTPEIGRPGGP